MTFLINAKCRNSPGNWGLPTHAGLSARRRRRRVRVIFLGLAMVLSVSQIKRILVPMEKLQEGMRESTSARLYQPRDGREQRRVRRAGFAIQRDGGSPGSPVQHAIVAGYSLMIDDGLLGPADCRTGPGADLLLKRTNDLVTLPTSILDASNDVGDQAASPRGSVTVGRIKTARQFKLSRRV